MRLKFLVILFFPILSIAQNSKLEFNKNYYECEDKWVVFPKSDPDTTYMYGFIYLDEKAGFTFNLESQFKILETGQFFGYPRSNTTNIKLRLEPNTKLVAIMPPEKIAELNLPIVPEWLKFYKDSTGTLKSLLSRGFHYNHAGASHMAIIDLESAYELERHPAVIFELAFAYNATEQFENAESILKEGIESNPDYYIYYRELGYALIRLNKIEEAEQTYLKGIKLSDDKFQKSEMAVNMAQTYFQLMDKNKFKEWAKLTRKYAEKDSEYMEYIKYLEEEINN